MISRPNFPIQVAVRIQQQLIDQQVGIRVGGAADPAGNFDQVPVGWLALGSRDQRFLPQVIWPVLGVEAERLIGLICRWIKGIS